MQDASHCLVCDSADLSPVAGFAVLPRITSDCRAFAPGGELFVCLECGTVQKQPSTTWVREIGEIYSKYASYYQSGGDEQVVFDVASGRPRRRSDVLMERLAGTRGLPAVGTALDVGCGNGVTLISMSTLFPQWALNGFELSEGARPRLERIPGFEQLYTTSLPAIGRQFDLVTMIHSLEHFPSPKEALESVWDLVGDGHLFIEVCDFDQNPFDILVADHVIHFSRMSLHHLLGLSGFSQISSTTDWVHKEISCLARGGAGREEFPGSDRAASIDVWKRTSQHVAWLRAMIEAARNLASGLKPFGIFGTSIAATWVGSQLDGKIAFFVDEDESRVGKVHLERPILRPTDVPRGSVVYLTLAPVVAEMVARKLATLPIDFVLPPRLGSAAV